MTVNDLETLYDYSYWANARLFPVVSALTTEEFVKRVAGSWGSVRNTLVHMMSAEGGWLERAGGPKRGAALQPDDFPTLPHVVGYWAAQERNVRRFIGGMTGAGLGGAEGVTVPPPALTVGLTIGGMVHHPAHHNNHHRAPEGLLSGELGFGAGAAG